MWLSGNKNFFRPKRNGITDNASFNDRLVPLINVIFLLLIFFMFGSPIASFEQKGINLPQAKLGESEKTGQFIEINLTREGDLFIEKDKIKIADLHEILAILFAHRKGAAINIHADAETSSENLSQLLAVLEKYKDKTTKIALIIEEKKTK